MHSFWSVNNTGLGLISASCFEFRSFSDKVRYLIFDLQGMEYLLLVCYRYGSVSGKDIVIFQKMGCRTSGNLTAIH